MSASRRLLIKLYRIRLLGYPLKCLGMSQHCRERFEKDSHSERATQTAPRTVEEYLPTILNHITSSLIEGLMIDAVLGVERKCAEMTILAWNPPQLGWSRLARLRESFPNP
jgi:hypothetical protein